MEGNKILFLALFWSSLKLVSCLGGVSNFKNWSLLYGKTYEKEMPIGMYFYCLDATMTFYDGFIGQKAHYFLNPFDNCVISIGFVNFFYFCDVQNY